MTDWSGLLERSVAAARPPAFEGVLRRARRRRRRTIVSAGLAVLVVIGGTALAVGSTSTSSHPTPVASPVPGIGQPPAAIMVGGKRLPLVGAQRTGGVALVDGASSRALRLKPPEYPDRGDSYCGITYRAYLLGQDSQAVRVGVYGYGRALQRSSFGCVDRRYAQTSFSGLQDLQIPLGVPLGARKVYADRELAVLHTDTLLGVRGLPPGYVRMSESVGLSPDGAGPFDEQDWRMNDQSHLLLQQGEARQEPFFPDGVKSAHQDATVSTRVRGRLGSELTRTRPDTTVHCLRWLEVRPVALCSESRHPLSFDQLHRMADALESRDSAHDNALVPVVVRIGAAVFELVGDEAVPAVYATAHADQVEVRAGRDTSRPECGPITRSYVLSEDSSVVRIGTYFYEGIGGDGGSCPLPAEARQTLHLRRALGSRVVVSTSGEELPVRP